jgi:hypothetical protein
MNRRRLLVIAGVLIAAGLLAFSFADTVREAVILPIAYFFWRAAQLYHAIPQQLVWAVLVVAAIYFAAMTLLDLSLEGGDEKKHPVWHGQIETLARSLDHRGEGFYFKWQVANLLGELALDILTYQERLLPGRRLQGRGWEPPGAVRRYLDAGLNTTFAEYPTAGRFGRTVPTPNFDVDLDLVLDYLEGQLEVDEDDHDAA